MEPTTDETEHDIQAALDHPDDRIGSVPDIPGLSDTTDADTVFGEGLMRGSVGGAADIADTAGSGDHTDFDDAVGQIDASGQVGGSRPTD